MTNRLEARPHADPAWFGSVALVPGVRSGFTGRVAGTEPGAVGASGNLSHARPHVPARLADERASLAARLGVEVHDLVFMRQVHGADVAVVTDETPVGAEVRGVDALVTTEVGRPLCVQVADCVPVLFASERGPIGVAHAGRRGVELGVVTETLAALDELGAPTSTVHAAIGPAIGGCCYEVPAAMQHGIVEAHPAAEATTTWGTPSLDLPAAVAAVLREAGVAQVEPPPGCTRCDREQRWFSHRADPTTGRQVGVVVRDEAA